MFTSLSSATIILKFLSGTSVCSLCVCSKASAVSMMASTGLANIDWASSTLLYDFLLMWRRSLSYALATSYVGLKVSSSVG